MKVLFLSLIVISGLEAQNLKAVKDDNGIRVTENAKDVLYYQLSTKDHHGQYPRANYIHPLYGIDGSVLSEDFPSDHLHHRGIFWAWHQLYVGGQYAGDPWECIGVKWEVQSADFARMKGSTIQLKINTHLKSLVYPTAVSSTPIIEERSLVTIFKAKKKYRVIDVELQLKALVSDVEIGGSDNEKGYGGFSIRVKLPDDVQFLSEGGEVTPHINAVDAGKWMNITGSLSDHGSTSGVVVVASEQNPVPNNKWILRKQRSMQNPAWPGQYRVEISQESPTILKYRMIVYDGELSQKKIKKLSRDF